MFTKDEYRAEIDAAAAKAAASQQRYNSAVLAESAAVEARGAAYTQWQSDLAMLDACVRLYVKAHLSSSPSSPKEQP